MSPAKEGESELYERMVREAMERLRFSRKKAETMAQKLLRRFRKNPKVLAQEAASTAPKKKVSAKRLFKAAPAPIQSLIAAPARKTPGKQKKPKNQKAFGASADEGGDRQASASRTTPSSAAQCEGAAGAGIGA